MRLTLYTDYSLRILLYLAIKDGELATIQEIAERYAISKNHLMKIVHNLGKDGYVVSVRGRHGGVRLTRSPKAINIGEVVRRYEDDLRIVECFDRTSNTCPIAGACALANEFDDALEAFLKTLDQKTLADILKASPKIPKKLGL